MTRLMECPACRNHVRASANLSSCPFCEHAFRTPTGPETNRGQRHAPSVQAVASALLSLGLVACEADTGGLLDRDAPRPADAATDDAPDASGGPLDAGTADTGLIDAGAPTDSGVETLADATIVPMYGLPPPNTDGGQLDAGGEEVDASAGEVDGGPVVVPLYGIAPPIRDAGLEDAAFDKPDSMS